jgi:hypothetical protein
MSLRLTYREIESDILPDDYVLVGMYAGTVTCTLGVFWVLREWWEEWRKDPEIGFDGLVKSHQLNQNMFQAPPAPPCKARVFRGKR